jgi:hypothetical protein
MEQKHGRGGRQLSADRRLALNGQRGTLSNLTQSPEPVRIFTISGNNRLVDLMIAKVMPKKSPAWFFQAIR